MHPGSWRQPSLSSFYVMIGQPPGGCAILAIPVNAVNLDAVLEISDKFIAALRRLVPPPPVTLAAASPTLWSPPTIRVACSSLKFTIMPRPSKRTSDRSHFKGYMATTKDMVAKRKVRQFSFRGDEYEENVVAHAAAGAPGCLSGWARAKASMVASELTIRVKFGNGVVSTLKNFAPAAWLARQTSASVIVSPWQ